MPTGELFGRFLNFVVSDNPLFTGIVFDDVIQHFVNWGQPLSVSILISDLISFDSDRPTLEWGGGSGILQTHSEVYWTNHLAWMLCIWSINFNRGRPQTYLLLKHIPKCVTLLELFYCWTITIWIYLHGLKQNCYSVPMDYRTILSGWDVILAVYAAANK